MITYAGLDPWEDWWASYVHAMKSIHRYQRLIEWGFNVKYCEPFEKHEFEEEYYGHKCSKCSMFIPYGCEPWLPVDDEAEVEAEAGEAAKWEGYYGK